MKYRFREVIYENDCTSSAYNQIGKCGIFNADQICVGTKKRPESLLILIVSLCDGFSFNNELSCAVFFFISLKTLLLHIHTYTACICM